MSAGERSGGGQPGGAEGIRAGAGIAVFVPGPGGDLDGLRGAVMQTAHAEDAAVPENRAVKRMPIQGAGKFARPLAKRTIRPMFFT